jgi:hypothetical protein
MIMLYLALGATSTVFGALGFILFANAMGLRPPGAPSPAASVSPTAVTQFADALAANTNRWLDSAQCHFTGGAYHALPGAGSGSVVCLAPVGTFGDFDLSVTASPAAGPVTAPYGLAFRRTGPGDFYIFSVDAEGLAWMGKYANGQYQKLTPYWPATGFVAGLGKPNGLRVTANGSTITGYVDGKRVGTLTDSTYATGEVGLYSGADTLDVAYSNFAVAVAP